jgi:transposase InsO family protein
MSRKGNCWDNAVAESFFKTLKTEQIYGNKLISKEQMERYLNLLKFGTIEKEGIQL